MFVACNFEKNYKKIEVPTSDTLYLSFFEINTLYDKSKTSSLGGVFTLNTCFTIFASSKTLSHS